MTYASAIVFALSLLGATSAAEPAPPPAPSLAFVFEAEVTLAPDVPVGDTSRGRRNIVPITGGSFAGPDIRGTIVPGGWDWQLFRADGCLDIKADYFLRTDDGAVIHIVNTGVACRPAAGERATVTTSPVFEAPRGRYDWLNRATFVDTLVPGKTADGTPVVRLRFYRVRT